MTRPLSRLVSLLALTLVTTVPTWAVPLKISVNPAGATIVTETGQRLPAPATIELKRRDTAYTFTIEKPGYQTETATWNTKEKIRELTIALAPLATEKEITIKTSPDGATVTIDGKPAGPTPLTRPATFTRDTKHSPWKPLAVTVAKTDYQSEAFNLAYDNPTASATLGQLRKERVFSVDAKAGEGSAIAATLTLGDRELGVAPQKFPVVFSRTDKTKPWPTFALTAEIPTIYQPATVTLTHDYKDIFSFTLKPVTELAVGLFAPTARHGEPAAFARFVDRCHASGVGVIVDWVPAHFPTDPHGLARFDGTALYEHLDPRQGFHPDWNTAIFNFGRREVSNYLVASALYWLERFHVDGLRVDAVASMLYLDYSRKAGEWVPNPGGGNENLEAIAFLRRLNETVYGLHPGIVMIAEESTAWPGVSRPTSAGGLGFGFKWNMGWMNDTLAYVREDPVHRRWHHDRMTFGLIYAFTENFVLPLSHDEVVHGKGSLLARMPGDAWQKFAGLRAYYAFMWAHPGKKLLFMGQEFAQGREWSHDGELDWGQAGVDWHRGVQALVRDLNRLHRRERALHERDCEPEGFAWIEVSDRASSVFAWSRHGGEGASPVVAVANFTPVPREGYRLGLPRAGRWREILNTDAAAYGGSNAGNAGGVEASGPPSHGLPQSAGLRLPPLATLWLVHDGP